MKRWTVYCHTHVESGRRYVGLTCKTMLARWNQHVYTAKRSKGGRWHFPNAIRKYGPQAFSHEVLEICDSLEDANLAEERWIELFDTRNPERGFNLARGGGSRPHPIRKNPWTPEARRRMSESVRVSLSDPDVQLHRSEACKKKWLDPAYRSKIAAIPRNVVSEETRRKLSQSRRGQKYDSTRRARLSVAIRRAMSDPDIKRLQSERMKKAWTDPEYRQRILNKLRRARSK